MKRASLVALVAFAALTGCTTGDAPSPEHGSIIPVTPLPDSAPYVFADAGDDATDADAAAPTDAPSDAPPFDGAACLGPDGGTIATHTFPWNFTVAGGTGQQVSVKRCDVVQWNNTDSVDHTVTSDTLDASADSGLDAGDAGLLPFAFDTGTIGPSSTSGPIQLTEKGFFGYHCSIHAGLTGHITVH